MTKLRNGLARYARESRAFGARYATMRAIETVCTRLILRPVQDRLLSIESDRGILGPEHRQYSGHSVAANRALWGGWSWREDAEDWTHSEEWKNSMLENLVWPTMSAGGVILEIGPGGGRWSKHLAEVADELILVDITERTLALCRERLADNGHVRLIQNDGADLPGVADASVDRIWSFDVFVHIAPADTASYLAEAARVLRSDGIAVIHHPGASRPLAVKDGWRSPMSAKLFANLARDTGLRVQRQMMNWPGSQMPLAYGDVITIMSRV